MANSFLVFDDDLMGWLALGGFVAFLLYKNLTLAKSNLAVDSVSFLDSIRFLYNAAKFDFCIKSLQIIAVTLLEEEGELDLSALFLLLILVGDTYLFWELQSGLNLCVERVFLLM